MKTGSTVTSYLRKQKGLLVSDNEQSVDGFFHLKYGDCFAANLKGMEILQKCESRIFYHLPFLDAFSR